MANPSKNLDDLLAETLAVLAEASEILATGPKAGPRGVSGGQRSAARRWLYAPPTLLLFRKDKWAEQVCEQATNRGFSAVLFQRYLLIEAPWLLVAALMASIGLDAELVAVHWERIEPEEKNSHPDEARGG
jgi:hypothetical protein